MGKRHVHGKRGRLIELSQANAEEDPIERLITRARVTRRRGDMRGAIVMLKRACARDEWRARPFVLLGAWLVDAGHHEEAVSAFLHARWVQMRTGEAARAAVTARLAEEAGGARAA